MASDREAFLYRVCGLTLLANLPLPGLISLETLETFPKTFQPVRVQLGNLPPLHQFQREQWYVSASPSDTGKPNLQVWQCFYRERSIGFYWQYGDETEFFLQRSPLKIWVCWPDSLTLEDAATYLLGPVLAFVLRWQKVLCLHASAIAVEGKAIAFVGVAGAGKSTTAAAFANLGHPVLSDDVVAVEWREKSPYARPAYPRLRLWPESVGFLYGSRDRLPAIVPTNITWNKRYLDLMQEQYAFQDSPLPLRQIYLLQGRQGENAPRIGEISQRKAAIALIANTSTNYLLDRDLRKAEFASVTRLVGRVPVKKLYPHCDPAKLVDLVRLVLSFN
ncbi:MAG: hypothetical protein J7647_32255 [Cyanobacteria bacterium SBLK]|nr:hypothetical protein [Cyanobacteria bacterium SBLK]